ncbi:MAG: protein kinase, partial [Myxococcales bacterium]|nr:protein kinase [Myxococcales bacterium]
MQIGTTVAGRYRLDRELGRGGWGVVFAATPVHGGPPVAVKLLLQAAMPAAVKRFEREAQVVRQLHSGHVCRVFDAGVEDGTPYLAMELLEGE